MKVKQIIITSDSKYMATRDDDCCVCLFHYEHIANDPNLRIEWSFNGKMRAHLLDITAVAFGETHRVTQSGEVQTRHRLFSVGEDRRFVEYDIYESDESRGLKVVTVINVKNSCEL